MVKDQEGAGQTMLVIGLETSKWTQWLPVSLRLTSRRAKAKVEGKDKPDKQNSEKPNFQVTWLEPFNCL